MIVPTLRVGMPPVTLCVTRWDAERPELHYHAERGNDHLRCVQEGQCRAKTGANTVCRSMRCNHA
ncbi:hypothetical protein CQ009_02925 [Pseudomonas sp. MYb2]|nr:hypothetical protein CQ025_09825 [Pseudomonas sp. MYb3]PRC36527.1 hypothetical protein CQ009_02925 [Pseudomonas sp. MYb2]